MLRFLAFLSFISFAAPASAQCGVASFYGHGDGFAGQPMANGQPMNPQAMITAHPSLPLGTRLRVENRANGKAVVVRVLDRGPWYGGRVLDLSYAAFRRLASPGQGLARICYKVV